VLLLAISKRGLVPKMYPLDLLRCRDWKQTSLGTSRLHSEFEIARYRPRPSKDVPVPIPLLAELQPVAKRIKIKIKIKTQFVHRRFLAAA